MGGLVGGLVGGSLGSLFGGMCGLIGGSLGHSACILKRNTQFLNWARWVLVGALFCFQACLIGLVGGSLGARWVPVAKLQVLVSWLLEA